MIPARQKFAIWLHGEYQITVSAAGFKEYKSEKITLKSGSTMTP